MSQNATTLILKIPSNKNLHLRVQQQQKKTLHGSFKTALSLLSSN